MQTFLPYPDFTESARCLDRTRLGKQRVEVLQILQSIRNRSSWSKHPAVKMWIGYENALVEYGVDICKEWIRRGYNDTCLSKIRKFLKVDKKFPYILYPDWLGDQRLHASHRSNLLRKDFQFYSLYGWSEVPSLEYFWPTEFVVCPYCDKQTQRVTGKVIYPHYKTLHKKNFYLCRDCDAYVGCHFNGLPLGKPANRSLRLMRRLAHIAFDNAWKDAGLNRTEAYKLLAQTLKITAKDCHIAHFDIEMCKKVVELYKDGIDIRSISK